MTAHRHQQKDELRVRFGRLGVVGSSRGVLAALALVALVAGLAQCGGERLAAIARCVWQGRPMDPEPAPGQQRPPCSPSAAPYGHGCYILATRLDGSLYLPSRGSCGDDFYGPWSWPAGTAERCWYRFFPRNPTRPAAEAAVWNVLR